MTTMATTATPTAKRPQSKPSRDVDFQYHVAIVGAGFAGLTLATYLERRNDDFSCHIFEAKQFRSTPVIVGTIRLPSLAYVLNELQLQLPRKYTDKQNHKDPIMMVRREVVLETLRSGVPKKIHYGSRVSDILEKTTTTTTNNNNNDDNDDGARRYYLRIEEKSEHDDHYSDHGPFDLVVGAEGFVLEESDPLPVSVHMGDCRWQDQVWWDFGSTRRSRGADIAMTDALELGKLIVLRQQQQQEPVSFGKFTAPSSKERLRRRRKRLLLSVFMFPVVLSAFYRLFQNFEKI